MAIPEDLQNLRDFPQYDASFQDHPHFRQRLEQWAEKTKKLANGLSSLADAFDRFHETGLEHYKAATSVIANLQEIAGVCENDSTNTLSSYLQGFVDSLNKIWCYYEAFLGQTQMLNATPVRELANNFIGLTALHEQVLQYRQEHLKTAEKFCACKHASKLTDKSVLPALSETCYSSQKTYQLVLSKFVISLRQAHTIDMISFMRRVLEFFLSNYAYHNYCTEVLKELEPSVSGVFTQTKAWRAHHEREMRLWNKLHISVKKNVLAEYHHNVGCLPDNMETTPTWSAISAGRHVMKKMFPSQSKDIKQSGGLAGEGDCEHNEETGLRRATFAFSAEREGGSKEGSPVPTRRETVGQDMGNDNSRVKRELRRKALQSSSNPDLLDLSDLSDPGLGGSNGRLRRGESPGSSSSSGGTPPPSAPGMVVTYSEDTTEAAAEAMEEFLSRPPGGNSSGGLSHFKPLSVVFGGRRGRKKKKKGSNILATDDPSTPESPLVIAQSQGGEEGSGGSNPSSPLHREGEVTSSPSSSRKGGGVGMLRRAKGSLLNHLRSHDRTDESSEVRGERSDDAESVDVGESGRVKNKKKRTLGSLSEEPDLQPRLEISSPLTRDWSGTDLRNDELQGLIQPLPPSWSKMGYLWLRMHTAENRYEWTHIWCIVDNESGEVKVQRDEDHAPFCLENLMLCSTKLCTPEYIDRNYCFRVISPCSEHLFQALSSHDQTAWVHALQASTAQAIKMSSGRAPVSRVPEGVGVSEGGGGGEKVSDAMELILAVPGNQTCADCSSSMVEWASVNLGLVLCIKCSGVHRGLGVHVSKVRSLDLDQWDRHTVNFMLRQGNKKANCYYEATLGSGEHTDLRKPATNATKAERSEFIQQKYIALAFTPPLTERTSSC